MMDTAYCQRHGYWPRDDEDCCRFCADEVAREHPQFASEIRRRRFWTRAYAAITTAMALLILAGWYAFLAYREWRIWAH